MQTNDLRDVESWVALALALVPLLNWLTTLVLAFLIARYTSTVLVVLSMLRPRSTADDDRSTTRYSTSVTETHHDRPRDNRKPRRK